jgi:hypothetical protein
MALPTSLAVQNISSGETGNPKQIIDDSESNARDSTSVSEQAKEDTMSLQARWKEAVVQWKGDLLRNAYNDAANFQAVDDFRSWEDLIENLRDEQKTTQQSTYHVLIEQMYPCLKTINNLFPVLAATIAMPESSKEVTMIWTVLYLGIKVIGTIEERS